jgi:hypothetical protein
LSARNKRIEPAALANLSCANDIPFESILRQNDVQNRFHTASVISGQTIASQNPPLSAVGNSGQRSAPALNGSVANDPNGH